MNYIYDTKKVKKGRNPKQCDLCNSSIAVGESSITVIINHQPEFVNNTLCLECEHREEELLKIE